MVKYLVLVPALLSLLVFSGCTQLTTQQATIDWCVAGETWLIDSREVGPVVGAVMYKGQARCQVAQTIKLNPSGEMIRHLYILDEESNDFWTDMIDPTIGQVTARIVNKVDCVEGDCDYFTVSTNTPSTT